MTNSQYKALINKYAILIFIGYALTYLISIAIQHVLPKFALGDSELIQILSSSAWIIQLIVNIIAAVLVSKDLKTMEIKNSLIIVMTVLFSLIGVTMFLLTVNKEIKHA